MTPKEALRGLCDLSKVDNEDFRVWVGLKGDVEQALNERDIYYQALCDIESGKDVRMILERVLT